MVVTYNVQADGEPDAQQSARPGNRRPKTLVAESPSTRTPETRPRISDSPVTTPRNPTRTPKLALAKGISRREVLPNFPANNGAYLHRRLPY